MTAARRWSEPHQTPSDCPPPRRSVLSRRDSPLSETCRRLSCVSAVAAARVRETRHGSATPATGAVARTAFTSGGAAARRRGGSAAAPADARASLARRGRTAPSAAAIERSVGTPPPPTGVACVGERRGQLMVRPGATARGGPTLTLTGRFAARCWRADGAAIGPGAEPVRPDPTAAKGGAPLAACLSSVRRT